MCQKEKGERHSSVPVQEEGMRKRKRFLRMQESGYVVGPNVSLCLLVEIFHDLFEHRWIGLLYELPLEDVLPDVGSCQFEFLVDEGRQLYGLHRILLPYLRNEWSKRKYVVDGNAFTYLLPVLALESILGALHPVDGRLATIFRPVRVQVTGPVTSKSPLHFIRRSGARWTYEGLSGSSASASLISPRTSNHMLPISVGRRFMTSGWPVVAMHAIAIAESFRYRDSAILSNLSGSEVSFGRPWRAGGTEHSHFSTIDPLRCRWSDRQSRIVLPGLTVEHFLP